MIEVLKIEDFDQMYHVMQYSFPPEERRTYNEQKALFNDPRYRVYVQKEQGSVIAFLASWHLDGFVFFEHFAVAKEKRNCGVGGRFLQEVVQTVKTLVCLEVEPPRDEFSCRRIGFYERNGFTLNDYPYMQPSITAGQPPIPLMLMTIGGSVTEAEFLNLKNQLYREIYKCEE
ncbi:MAG: GNAT family N-acetyltransferase [Clostridia bacterium]|nr:GNAT family N-acetyltransferase [Clostridia bacterium]